MVTPPGQSPQGPSLTTQLQEIQSEAATLRTRVSHQTQILIFNPTASTRTEDLNPDTSPAFLAAESNRLKEKFTKISLTCTTSDPKMIAQMREIALELERDAIAIEGFKVLVTQPQTWIDLQPNLLKRTDNALAMIDTVQADLGRYGRYKVRRQTKALGFNKLLTKINQSTEQLHRNIKRTPSVETPDQRITKFKEQISTFELELADIQLKATLLNSLWDADMQDAYARKILGVAGKIQMLKWEQEAFLKVFSPKTQKVLDAGSGIHTVLKKVNRENSGFKVSDALRIYKKAEEGLANIPKDSNAYVVAAQALKAAKAEIDATVKKYEIPKKEQQRIAVELTKPNPTIREGRFRNDLPVVAQVLSQKIQAIRFETNAEKRGVLINEFEDMWNKLEARRAKLLDVKEFLPIIRAYQAEYAGEIEAAAALQLSKLQTPEELQAQAKKLSVGLLGIRDERDASKKSVLSIAFDEIWGKFTKTQKDELLKNVEFSRNLSLHRQNYFREMAPHLIERMRDLSAGATEGIFRQEPGLELAAFHKNFRNVKAENNVHVLGRVLRNLMSDLHPPLLSLEALDGQRDLFEIISENQSSGFMATLHELLKFLSEVNPNAIDRVSLARLWGPVFFGVPPGMTKENADTMEQAVLGLISAIAPRLPES